MSVRHPMTKSGALALQDELDQLVKVERKAIIQAIADARELGDLKENAEYHAAKEKQSFIEGRIKEIENKLSGAQIIDVTTIENQGKVIFGSTVALLRLNDDKEETYSIVGDDEVDLKKNKISFNSPLARALIGKSALDVVEVNTPNGDIEYEITHVDYI